MNNDEFDFLKDICDDGTTYVTVSHIFRGNKDMCQEYFGESDETCVDKKLDTEEQHAI